MVSVQGDAVRLGLAALPRKPAASMVAATVDGLIYL
jgi:hypothetical protein